MKKEELIMDTKRKLDEINRKIEGIKNRLSQDTNEETKKHAQSALDDLEKIKAKVQENYLNLGGFANTGPVKLPELEKNIYNSIESFNRAYTKAGAIFSTK
jgi:hypothetical protein